MADIRLFFLDQVRIIQGEEVVPGLPRKLIALLGLLSVEPGRAGPADRLSHLLWPDVSELHARKSLNQLLVRSRRLLPGALERPAEQQVTLSAAVVCDVHDLLFREPFGAAASPSHATFEFLPGFSIRGCPELNDWLDGARSRVRRRAALAALDRVRALAPAAALPWAAMAYELDRADERIAEAFIRSLAAVRGPAAAWAAFAEHRRWLSDELDITPSARLTSSVAESCRQAGARTAAAAPAPATGVAAAALETPAAALHAQPVDRPAASSATSAVLVSSPRRWLQRPLQAAAVLAVVAALSLFVWQNQSTPGAAAGTTAFAVVSTPLAATPPGDSALRIASAHLALHHVVAELVENAGRAAAIRITIPGWHGEPAPTLMVTLAPGATVDGLAAALADSALSLVLRTRRQATSAADVPRDIPAALRDAHEALGKARELIATGGANAAMVMFDRADYRAAAVSRKHDKVPDSYVFRAQIANEAFWNGMAAGEVDPGVLHRGLAAADTAVQRGGSTSALKARAALNFSLWVFGASGAEAAGRDAQRDYEAVVAASPDDGEAWSRLAQLHHADGRLSDAYSAALQAERFVSGPQRLDSFMELFLASLDRNDDHMAQHWCSEIAFHYPGSWFAARCAAMYAWAEPSSDRTASAGLFSEPTPLQQSLENQLLLLGAGADLARGNQSAALRKVAQVGSSIDSDQQLASIWAGILVQLGQPDSALSTLRRYLGGAPSRRFEVGRPWLRSLYRPNESWADFVARVTGEDGSLHK